MPLNILYYGDDPSLATGYATTGRDILTRLHRDGHKIACLGVSRQDEDDRTPFENDRLPFKIFRCGQTMPNDPDVRGIRRLVDAMTQWQYDAVLINADIWNYAAAIPSWDMLREQKNCAVVLYFSSEFPFRQEWVWSMRSATNPVTFTRFGYDKLKELDPRLKYIPNAVDAKVYHPLPPEQRAQLRKQVGIPEDAFLVTNVNRNHVRKDIAQTIRAFRILKNAVPDALLYLHCKGYDDEVDRGAMSLNLPQFCSELGLVPGRDVRFPAQGFTANRGIPLSHMASVYQCSDVVVSTSLSEGFGLTPVEASMCSVPTLIPDTSGLADIAMALGIEPVKTLPQPIYHDTVAPVPFYQTDHVDLARRLVELRRDPARGKDQAYMAYKRALRQFEIAGVYDRAWRPLFTEIEQRLSPQKIGFQRDHAHKDTILFVCDSSAGDVLMATSAIAGLKKKHPDKAIHAMTRTEYQNIWEGNPDVDKMLNWDLGYLAEYPQVHYPHRQIRNGNWGSGSMPLSRIQSRLCDVEHQPHVLVPEEPPAEIVELLFPNAEEPMALVAFHTTSHPYRTYRRFGEVASALHVRAVQVGGEQDVPLEGCDFVDLRGKLTWRQTAWVLSKSAFLVGIDSYPAHAMGAVGGRSAVVFGCGNARITAPERGLAIAFMPEYAAPGMCPMLGACYGNARNCPANCINSHAPDDILKGIIEAFGLAYVKEDAAERLGIGSTSLVSL